MKNGDIHKLALKKIIDGSDIALISTIYFFTVMLFAVLSEILIYILLRMAGFSEYRPLNPDYYRTSRAALIMLILRCGFYMIVFSTLMFLVYRSFLTFTENGTGQVYDFLRKHIRRMLLPSLKSNVCFILLKLLAALPLTVSIYGVVHFARLAKRGAVGMGELFVFMISTGFTLIWICVLLRYYLSLCLVPFIIDLNPRGNFFDACDLSIKLMDGNHMRVVFLMITMLPLLLPCLLIYPSLIVYPYITECKLLLAKEIMGGYWQDKLPAMARRWEKSSGGKT